MDNVSSSFSGGFSKHSTHFLGDEMLPGVHAYVCTLYGLVRASLPVCRRVSRAGPAGQGPGWWWGGCVGSRGAHSLPRVRNQVCGEGFLLQPASLIVSFLKARHASVRIARQHVDSIMSSLA